MLTHPSSQVTRGGRIVWLLADHRADDPRWARAIETTDDAGPVRIVDAKTSYP